MRVFNLRGRIAQRKTKVSKSGRKKVKVRKEGMKEVRKEGMKEVQKEGKYKRN